MSGWQYYEKMLGRISSGLFYSLIMYCVLCNILDGCIAMEACFNSITSKYWYSASIIKGNYDTNLSNTFHDLCVLSPQRKCLFQFPNTESS